MAVAIRSIGAPSSGATSATGVTIAIPSGLTAGDLMLAIVGAKPGTNGNVAAGQYATPSGWAQIGSATFSTNTGLSAFWKIADSTDVAASGFTFSFGGTPTNGSTTSVGGWIYAVTGADATTPIVANGQFGANGSPATISGGITPGVANCMLFFGADSASTSATFTVANVSVTNNNPTWTRQNLSAFSAIEMAVATGTYTATTTTGTANWIPGVTNNYGVKLIAVQPATASLVQGWFTEPTPPRSTSGKFQTPEVLALPMGPPNITTDMWHPEARLPRFTVPRFLPPEVLSFPLGPQNNTVDKWDPGIKRPRGVSWQVITPAVDTPPLITSTALAQGVDKWQPEPKSPNKPAPTPQRDNTAIAQQLISALFPAVDSFQRFDKALGACPQQVNKTSQVEVPPFISPALLVAISTFQTSDRQPRAIGPRFYPPEINPFNLGNAPVPPIPVDTHKLGGYWPAYFEGDKKKKKRRKTYTVKGYTTRSVATEVRTPSSNAALSSIANDAIRKAKEEADARRRDAEAAIEAMAQAERERLAAEIEADDLEVFAALHAQETERTKKLMELLGMES